MTVEDFFGYRRNTKKLYDEHSQSIWQLWTSGQARVEIESWGVDIEQEFEW